MGYERIKIMGANCPTCSRRLELLVARGKDEPNFAICFKCKSVIQLGQGSIPLKTSGIDRELRSAAKKAAELLPSKYHYKAKGSALRYQAASETYERRWLSLSEYEKIFGETLAFSTDFRSNPNLCKWCGSELPAGRRSFCADKCSRNYSRVTFQKRGMSTVPYRIALRDKFYCCATGADLALTNRHHIRIPASGAELAIHHLIFVSEGGSDHASNLITLSKQAHLDFHSGKPKIVERVEAIKKEQLLHFEKQMYSGN
ncbi:HNH endonuclease [Listeria floridensis FSL S10-1187]|uniref:HNH endonuclease n=1 Tax=Listeria floridensis FSL S10-1187 TaxID=1265817 RepID=A0ABN0RII2_9LIST|nr:HNH endonuclease [Listeria floridensis]EUJ33692.1 HNH endonuclease [Listeria floridensis FSL S10-1187]